MGFSPTDASCADCGAEAFASAPAPSCDDSVALCFGCYVDHIDRVRACCVVEVGGGEVVVGGRSVGEAGDVARRVGDELSPAGVGVSVGEAAPLAEARRTVGDYHARELARAARSESRHVYASTSERGSVVDVATRTNDGARAEVRDSLAKYVLDETRTEVRKRDDVSDAVVSLLPTLVEHRVPRCLGVEREAWDRAKERGVSRGSERASRNRRAGREFEECFREWCEERNLQALRGKSGLVRHHPEEADEIARKTDGLAGVPDFLVRGDAQNSFGSEWRPEEDVFVEVKRGDSTLTREQQTVVAHLKSLGFEVYVLRGEPGDHRFERR